MNVRTSQWWRAASPVAFEPSPKKICIDGFNLSMREGTGIATYARNLNESVRALGFESQILYGPRQSVARDSLVNEISLVDASQHRPSPRAMQLLRSARQLNAPLGRHAHRVERSGEVDTRQVRAQVPDCDRLWVSRDVFNGATRAYSAFGLFTDVRFPEAGEGRPDIMHWTCVLPMRAPKTVNLYTIHDIVPIKLPFATLDNKRRFVSLCRKLCGSADRIVTVSEQSKQDLVRVFDVDESRVAVTYQTVELPQELLARPDEEVCQTVEGVFGLDWRGYFIFFGASEPKKNLARIVEAYLSSGVSTPLVIVSGRGWLDDDVTQVLNGHVVDLNIDGETPHAGGRVRRYSHLPIELLVSLIRGAKATLLPSLYEGFGLPVLESMLLRTPVLASTAGSLPEVAGEAAVLVDPYDVNAIRDGIRALDADADLRAELTDRGVRQAARFSAEAYRARLADLYGALS
jgi:glycosyltransferase involved in cell wall biosynthesis